MKKGNKKIIRGVVGLLCMGLIFGMFGGNGKKVYAAGETEDITRFGVEGYAAAYGTMVNSRGQSQGTSGVTGGGVLTEDDENYYKADSAEAFLKALMVVKASGVPSVIELTADISLGCKEVNNFSDYKSVIKAYSNQPLTHPELLTTGTSVLKLEDVSNLTIFSVNGASILHANITMNNVENIMIRNIKFDELWEWDEETAGEYDRNDWDYMTLDKNCDGVWIDHCTFYKAYDGIVDIKNPAPESWVTISWCEFLPGSEDNIFFEEMLKELAANPGNYPTYQKLLDKGMTEEQIYMYCYGQKKTHLFGHSDNSTAAAGIRATLANNYYLNSMDRMPRLRYGYSHVYNCVMDSQELLTAKESITDSALAGEIVSNGASSTCEGYVLLENCYINGIQKALNSGNGKSPSGYINAVNSAYYINGQAAELIPTCNSSGDTRVLTTDAERFVEELPYKEYRLYVAESLYEVVVPFAGAGKLEYSAEFWVLTDYEGKTVRDFEVTVTEKEKEQEDNAADSTAEETDGEGAGIMMQQLLPIIVTFVAAVLLTILIIFRIKKSKNL